MYEYQATVQRVIDGDTVEFIIDLGFHVQFRAPMRLANYAAPEIDGTEKQLGSVAKAMLETLLPPGTTVVLNSKKADKYGRWLAEVSWRGSTLSDYLVQLGYGVSWNGIGPNPKFDPEQPYPLSLSPTASSVAALKDSTLLKDPLAESALEGPDGD